MNKNGFTLIEVVTGLVLLAIGLLAVVGMQLASVRGNSSSSNLTQASILAQHKLETLRTLDLTDANLTAGHYDTAATGDGPIPNTIFSREYDVTDGTDIKTITITVRWNDGSDRSVSFSTVRAAPTTP